MEQNRPYTTAQRLKELMQKRSLKQVDIIRLTEPLQKLYQTKISKTDLSQYVNGKTEPGQDKLFILAAALGVSEPWLIGYDISPDRNANESNTSSALISTHDYQYLDVGVACGAPALIDGYTNRDLQTVQLSDAVMGRYAGDKDIIVLHARGESMNRIFPDGALLAVKRTDEPQNGDIVIFSVDGQDYSCKRYYYNRDASIVSFQPDSDDSDFAPVVFRTEDMERVTIFGKVVVYTVVM